MSSINKKLWLIVSQSLYYNEKNFSFQAATHYLYQQASWQIIIFSSFNRMWTKFKNFINNFFCPKMRKPVPIDVTLVSILTCILLIHSGRHFEKLCLNFLFKKKKLIFILHQNKNFIFSHTFWDFRVFSLGHAIQRFKFLAPSNEDVLPNTRMPNNGRQTNQIPSTFTHDNLYFHIGYS